MDDAKKSTTVFLNTFNSMETRMNSELGKRKTEFEIPTFSQVSEDIAPVSERQEIIPVFEPEVIKIRTDGYVHENCSHHRDHPNWIRFMQTFPSRTVYMKKSRRVLRIS